MSGSAIKKQDFAWSKAGELDGELRMPRKVFDTIAQRAVQSARVSVELLCSPVNGASESHGMAWDTQQRRSMPTDRERALYDMFDLRQALECLDLLGLLTRPFPDQPHVVGFSPAIENYEPELTVHQALGAELH